MDVAADVRLLGGRYQLGSVIGRGGMGTVWRARDELLDRDVAVKEIAWPPYLSEAEQQAARRRAVSEAQLAARLRHPNVVGIYDIAEEDGHPWIIMELVPYRSLRDLLRDDGPLPPAQAAQLGLGILAALRAAHAEGIVHRDVKPGNILVGPGGHAVLTDFGIARAADSPTLTSDDLVGSPSYIAPERARGGQAGPAADLWGLGAALYAAVEGRAPFQRKDALASLTAAVTDEPEPATHAGPLWPAISGLLRKDPDRRLGAAEAERMLRRAARGDVAQPQWRSRRTLGALAAALAVTAAAATACTLPWSDSPGRSPVAFTEGSHPSAPPSAGRTSGATTPSSGSALPSGGAKSGKLPPGRYGLADLAGPATGLHRGWSPAAHQPHRHGQPGGQRHQPAPGASS
jgi:serine/threonine protein kinase